MIMERLQPGADLAECPEDKLSCLPSHPIQSWSGLALHSTTLHSTQYALHSTTLAYSALHRTQSAVHCTLYKTVQRCTSHSVQCALNIV